MLKKTLICLILSLTLLSIQSSALDCKSFEEPVIWSSGYGGEGPSLNYYSLKLNNSCEDCFIKKISVLSRVFSQSESKVKGVVQLSSGDKNCETPQNSNFIKYLSFEEVEPLQKPITSWNCGSPEIDNSCTLTKSDDYTTECLYFKLSSDKYSITDVTRINYTLCSENNLLLNSITGNFLKSPFEKVNYPLAIMIILTLVLIFGVTYKKLIY